MCTLARSGFKRGTGEGRVARHAECFRGESSPLPSARASESFFGCERSILERILETSYRLPCEIRNSSGGMNSEICVRIPYELTCTRNERCLTYVLALRYRYAKILISILRFTFVSAILRKAIRMLKEYSRMLARVRKFSSGISRRH